MQGKQRTILVGDTRVIYYLRRSRRAKRLILSLDHDGSVEVVIPWRASFRVGEAFIRERTEWLKTNLAQQAEKKVFFTCRDGTTVPFLGTTLTIDLVQEPTRKRTHVVRRGRLLVVKPAQTVTPRRAVEHWYRRQARDFFDQASRQAAQQLGVRVRGIRIGNFRSQWGSASRQGVLSYNWRLLLGPAEVAHYLVAHEVAHLVEANHSKAYWQVVKRLMPSFNTQRRWLKHHAHELSW